MAMGNGSGQPTDKTTTDERRELESIVRSSWSACVAAERLLVEKFGMPEEKRLALTREERQRFVRSYLTGGALDIDGDTC